MAPQKTRRYRMIGPYLTSFYKNLGLQNTFLRGKNALIAQPMLWPEVQILRQVTTGCGLLHKWQPKQIRPHRSVIRFLIFKQMSQLASIQIFSFKKCVHSYGNKKAIRFSELKNKKEHYTCLKGKHDHCLDCKASKDSPWNGNVFLDHFIGQPEALPERWQKAPWEMARKPSRFQALGCLYFHPLPKL